MNVLKEPDGTLVDLDDAFAVWYSNCVRHGIIPPNARRVIVEIVADEIVKAYDEHHDGRVTVYHERYADERMFTKDLMAMMEKGQRVHVDEAVAV